MTGYFAFFCCGKPLRSLPYSLYYEEKRVNGAFSPALAKAHLSWVVSAQPPKSWKEMNLRDGLRNNYTKGRTLHLTLEFTDQRTGHFFFYSKKFSRDVPHGSGIAYSRWTQPGSALACAKKQCLMNDLSDCTALALAKVSISFDHFWRKRLGGNLLWYKPKAIQGHPIFFDKLNQVAFSDRENESCCFWRLSSNSTEGLQWCVLPAQKGSLTYASSLFLWSGF